MRCNIMRIPSHKGKKGALDLSINSIVVIIFAVIMLGLGVAFINDMFSNVRDKVTFPDPEIEATASNPIVIPFDTVKVDKNVDVEFKINFYNTGEATSVTNFKPFVDCYNPGESMDDKILGLELKAISAPVDVADTAEFQSLLTVPADAHSTKHICKLKMCDASETTCMEKQFYLEVN
ncbi:MAG: hypothetical protein GY861_28945 [bacterium]|nr:hypothetical protein [bacterium]